MIATVQPFVAVLKDDPDRKQIPVLAIESEKDATYVLLASTRTEQGISSWRWVDLVKVADLWAGPPIPVYYVSGSEGKDASNG